MPDVNVPRVFLPSRLWKLVGDIENFYAVRQDNFRAYENWYHKLHGLTENDGGDEPVTPINLGTHMVNMVLSMMTQETPTIEVLTDMESKKARKRGNLSEKVFMGVLQANGEQQGRDLIYDFYYNLICYGWGITYTVWDDNRCPSHLMSDLAKKVRQDLRSPIDGDGPSSPDAIDYDDGDEPDDLMPIVVECPQPADVFPIPGGHRERWKGVFKKLVMRYADAEDYYGVELPRKTDEDIEDASYDDHQITTYDLWYYIGNSIWHCIFATGIPQYERSAKGKLERVQPDGIAYIKQPAKMPEYRRLPYEIRFCYPTTSSKGERFGHSLLYTVIDPIAAAERTASKMEMILDQYADPIMLSTWNSEMGGTGPVAISKEPGEVIYADEGKGEKVSILQGTGGPPEMERQRDFWIANAKEMGFDVNIEGTTGLDTIVKKSGILAKTAVPIRQAEKGLAATHARIIHLFTTMVSKPLKVRGEVTVDSSSEAYALDVSGKQLEGMDKAIVKIRARFPYEELQNAAAAQAVSSGDKPLVSLYRARGQYMNIQDPDAEAKRIVDEQLENHPLINEGLIQQALQTAMQPPPPEQGPDGTAVDQAGVAQAETINRITQVDPMGVTPSPTPMNATGNAPGAGPPNGSVQQTMQQQSAGRPPL